MSKHVKNCELCDSQGDVIINTPQWRVVLVDDAHYPGFCRVIWNAHVKEMSDLTPDQRTMLMSVVWEVESAIRNVMKPHKINVASLGNVTPHLHWHVIPRFTDDMHFPNPIWGQVERSVNGNLQMRQTLVSAVRAEIKTRLEHQ
jgi:diadenosine tetraphosphate (Ap4A) HIT family hydrolase